MEEVWVHSWTLSTFDVINVKGNLEKTHKAIKAHVKPGKYLCTWDGTWQKKEKSCFQGCLSEIITAASFEKIEIGKLWFPIQLPM